MIAEEKQVFLAGKIITEGLTSVRWQNQIEFVPLAVGIAMGMTMKSAYTSSRFFFIALFNLLFM